MNYAPKGLGERVWDRGQGPVAQVSSPVEAPGFQPLGTPLSQKTIYNNLIIMSYAYHYLI